MKERERNFVEHDLELAMVVHALKMWCHYLLAKMFLLLTDSTCIKNVFTQPKLNGRQARWMAFLSEFDFEVKHIKGKENKVDDALSRRTHGIYEINMSQLESHLRNRIKTTSIHDIEYMNLWNKLLKDEVNLNGT